MDSIKNSIRILSGFFKDSVMNGLLGVLWGINKDSIGEPMGVLRVHKDPAKNSLRNL